MTQKEKLRIFDRLMHKITQGLIASEYKNDKEYLAEILSVIRYSYCYPATNSYEGQEYKDIEKAQERALIILRDL